MPINQINLQYVHDALVRSRHAGTVAAHQDTTTLLTDDHDCYPRGLLLQIDKKTPRWLALCQISKQLDWVHLDARKQSLVIQPEEPIKKFRLTHHAYLEAVAKSLSNDGLECFPDINWH